MRGGVTVSSFEYDMERRRGQSEELIECLLLRETQIKIGCADDEIIWIWEGDETMIFAVLLAVDFQLISIFSRCGYSDEQILERLDHSFLAVHRIFEKMGKAIDEFIRLKTEMQAKGMSPEEIIAEFTRMRSS
jgi:hypothetical protein